MIGGPPSSIKGSPFSPFFFFSAPSFQTRRENQHTDPHAFLHYKNQKPKLLTSTKPKPPPANMQIVTILTTLALAATALAACANGPYLEGGSCGGGSDCEGAQRCSKNASGKTTNHVVRTAKSTFCSLPLTDLSSLISSLPFLLHTSLTHCILHAPSCRRTFPTSGCVLSVPRLHGERNM